MQDAQQACTYSIPHGTRHTFTHLLHNEAFLVHALDLLHRHVLALRTAVWWEGDTALFSSIHAFARTLVKSVKLGKRKMQLSRCFYPRELGVTMFGAFGADYGGEMQRCQVGTLHARWCAATTAVC